jgi:hypothetical protein
MGRYYIPLVDRLQAYSPKVFTPDFTFLLTSPSSGVNFRTKTLETIPLIG